jgi:hypothetical protein
MFTGFIIVAYLRNPELNIFLDSAGDLMYSTFSLLQGLFLGGDVNSCVLT